MATDNTPTQAWVLKGSTTSGTASAFLLRLLAHECRAWNSFISPVYATGSSNQIADFLSRSFHLSDADLLRALNSRFPHQTPWTIAIPPDPLISAMNLALSRKLPNLDYPVHEQDLIIPPGPFGQPSVATSPATHSYKTSPTPSPSSRYSLTGTGWEAWLPPVLQLKVEQWKRPFAPLVRHFPSWATKTPAYNLPANWTSGYIANCKPTRNSTHHPHV
jgi:hypothetical protein